VALAEEAELSVDMKKHLLKVTMYRGWSWSKNETQTYFEQRDWDVELPDDLIRQQRRARDLTWKEIGERIKELEEEKDGLAVSVAESRSRRGHKNSPADLNRHIANLENKVKERHRQVLALQAELQMRPALSLGCLFFVLIGCPVGIWFSRSDYLSSFITCFVPIVFIYYPLMLCGTGIAKDGRFATIATVWIADATVGLAGLVLFWRLLRN